MHPTSNFPASLGLHPPGLLGYPNLTTVPESTPPQPDIQKLSPAIVPGFCFMYALWSAGVDAQKQVDATLTKEQREQLQRGWRRDAK